MKLSEIWNLLEFDDVQRVRLVLSHGMVVIVKDPFNTGVVHYLERLGLWDLTPYALYYQRDFDAYCIELDFEGVTK